MQGDKRKILDMCKHTLKRFLPAVNEADEVILGKTAN